MDVRLQLFLVLCSLGFFATCFHLLRKGVMEYKYTLLWILASVLMLLIVVFPEPLFRFSAFVGVVDPTNMVFFIAFFLSLMIIFSLSIVVSDLTNRLRKLVQTVALLEKKVEDLKGADDAD